LRHKKVLNTLTPREAFVVKFRYGLTDGTEHTLAEIGRQLGINRERVRADLLSTIREAIYQSDQT
jgi:RNA polymerase primary sigma factor